MSERKEVDVKTFIQIMENNPHEECEDVLRMIRSGYDTEACSHPADYLEVRTIEVNRDVKMVPLSEQTGWYTSKCPDDYIYQQHKVGDTHFKVLVHCTKCNTDLYIFGVDPACR